MQTQCCLVWSMDPRSILFAKTRVVTRREFQLAKRSFETGVAFPKRFANFGNEINGMSNPSAAANFESVSRLAIGGRSRLTLNLEL